MLSNSNLFKELVNPPYLFLRICWLSPHHIDLIKQSVSGFVLGQKLTYSDHCGSSVQLYLNSVVQPLVTSAFIALSLTS